MSLVKNLFKNGLASILQKVVNVLQQLMLVPFFISAWGAEYYGEWITLTIIPSVLALSDFGFGSAAANTFVLRYASGDKQGAKNISKSGIILITGVIIFALFLSFLVLLILNHFGIFEKSILNKNEAILAVLFMMIARILNFYYQFYGGYFRAARKAAFGINLITLYTFVTLMASFLTLILGGGIVEFSLVTLIVSVLFNPFFAWKALKVVDFNQVEKAIVVKEDIKKITRKGFGYLMSPAWQAIYFQGTTFVVRLTLGASGVVIYNTIRTVTRSINQIFTIVNGSVFPEIQFEIGKGNMKKVRTIFVSSITIVLILAVFGCLFLFFFGQVFYELWTQKMLNPPSMMWNIFIIGIIFNAVWFTSGVVFNAYNQPYKYAFSGLICSIISVISSYFLCLNFGLVGSALGSIVLDVLMVFYVLPEGCKLIGQSLSTLITDMYRQFIYMLAGVLKKVKYI